MSTLAQSIVHGRRARITKVSAGLNCEFKVVEMGWVKESSQESGNRDGIDCKLDTVYYEVQCDMNMCTCIFLARHYNQTAVKRGQVRRGLLLPVIL